MLTATQHGGNGPLPDHIKKSDCASFGYFFPKAEAPPHTPDTRTHVEELHKLMVEDATKSNDSGLPPVFTYLGQFIDHDITNQFDTTGKVTDISGDIAPQQRDLVVDAIKNVRTGHLDLDSLYGPAMPTKNATLNRLIALMRFPGDKTKMRLAFPDPATKFQTAFPTDRAADLVRLDRAMADGVTKADLAKLPKEHLGLFLPDGEPNLSRALIGDSRNDENLFIGQLHMAYLRLHNRMVDAIRNKESGLSDTALFERAKTNMRYLHQWLVVNVYLPSICDPVAVREVLNSDAILYGEFLEACRGDDHGLPIPLEFSVAAFRFGHSMVRAEYDWNDRFGRAGLDDNSSAPFDQMFAFTGSGRPPMFGLSNRLPANWVGDFTRLATPMSRFPDRSARLIDTQIAHPLSKMVNEDAKNSNLIARNLKRGFRMNIPSAQAAIEKLVKTYGFDVPSLPVAALRSGPTGRVIKEAGFDKATPIWFYVLKEAEVMHRGQRLGPLGTHLVAGTLAGLVIHDRDSYWHQPGSIEGRWHPVDGPRPGGQIVDGMPALFRAAGLMKA